MIGAISGAAAAWRRAIRLRSGVLVPCGMLAVLLGLSVTFAIGFGAVPIPMTKVWAILAHESGATFGNSLTWTAPSATSCGSCGCRVFCWAWRREPGSRPWARCSRSHTQSPGRPVPLRRVDGGELGAVLVILYAGTFAGPWTLPGAAFLGALPSMAIVFGAARGRGGAPTSDRLVLTGVAVAFILHAATNFLVVGAVDRGDEAALFWMMGGLAGARWSTVPAPLLVTLAGIVWLCLRAASVNALAFGDDTARSLGIDPARLQTEMFVVTALITGAVVSSSGGIGFVGLVIPHIVRMSTGGDLRRLLPVSSLLGAIFLTWIDVLARQAFEPREIPLGIVTASIGGGVFLWLVSRRGDVTRTVG